MSEPAHDSAQDLELAEDEIAKLAVSMAELAAASLARPAKRTIRWAERAELEKTLLEEPPLEGRGADALLELARDGLFRYSREYRHPLNFGHQRPAPLAAAALAEWASTVANPGMAIYEMAPFAVTLEKRVIRWMAKLAGLPDDSAGTFVSGGTEGNLTALLCAREAGQRQARARGTPAPRRIFTSEGAHYSVARAAHVLGLGTDAVVKLPQKRCTLDIGALEQALEAARGEPPLAIVVAVASTAAGTIDDLAACARLARAHSTWLHVDAAHGGSLLLSPALAHRLDGIAQADSIVWDPHKLMWVPAPASVVLLRRRRDLTLGLAPGLEENRYHLDDASGPNVDADVDDLLRWTLACTRPASAFKVYATLAVYGKAGLARRIERVCALAQALHARVAATDDFENLLSPETNIVCFRHLPAAGRDDEARLDQHNSRLRETVARGPHAYLTGTRIAGRYWLRAQIMSPTTREADLDRLLTYLRSMAGPA